ncbi:hypothetical protein C2S53_003434 [Perilla frutescens var. hirtella]|uniref:Uncharacterized protein n=1 Tax=Perilla frutescens var. hirtella TaxID=608512 RepID=A0AAD4IRG9_PERFH|nr:hypothetical protein C2S53_003434 [Perilla frutescens var. hirtella]
MVGIEREIIWSENVRPSSPTPQNLKTYKLPMLDQVVPSILAPITLYFSNTVEISDHESFISHTTETLKRSLSLILSRYYPLAGRVGGDGHSIDCNDEGVPFVVARFKGCSLSDHVLKNPDPNLLCRLLPCDVRWCADHEKGGPHSSVALIQVNYFDCGGIAVAVVIWHKVVDAVAKCSFIKSWAAAARGSSTEAACPNFISQALFSHKEELLKRSVPLSAVLKLGNAVMRRYVFDAAAVSKLKAECGGVERPTRVEAVSAHIWKCFMAASLENNKSFSVLSHVVNLRRRVRPPFPSECFGNWAAAVGAASSNEKEADLGVLVRKIRDSIKMVDGDYVDRLRGDGGVSGYQENLGRTWSDVPVGGDGLTISSLCNSDFYSIDFGWGKPVWLTSPCDSKPQFVNTVCLMDGRNGDGVEAWVILHQDYMPVFHQLNHAPNLPSNL